MYKYTITIETGKIVVIDSEGAILKGKLTYANLDSDTRKHIAPDIYTLTRGVDKCWIKAFTVSLL